MGRVLRVPGAAAYPASAEVRLAIRPERIEDGPAGQSAEGVLTEVEFIGTDLRLTHRMACGNLIVQRRQNNGGRPAPTPGETRILGFRPEDLRLFDR